MRLIYRVKSECPGFGWGGGRGGPLFGTPTGKLLIAGGGAAEREESTTTIRGWLKNIDFTSDNR